MHNLKHDTTQILEMIHDEKWDQITTILTALHPADIADIIDRAPKDGAIQLFDILSDEQKPDVLSEIESNAETDILDSLTNHELSAIIEDMDPDDAADIVGNLTSNRSSKVLDLMDVEEAEDVRRLLEYEEESAGGIMTTDIVCMNGNRTVAEAIEAIAHLDEEEPFVYAYIVTEESKLIGYIDIWQLLREKNKDRQLIDICHKESISVNVNDDQEDVAHILGQYDLSAVPVVDNNNIVVGRVTVDDIIDVIEDEASEDIFHLAGSDDIELESNSAFKSCTARLPWLLITLFGGVLTSTILEQFNMAISKVIILGAFVPAILAMGGNTGIQASTLVVRIIALRGLKGRKITKLLIREILVGSLMGSICGLSIGAWSLIMLQHSPAPGFSSLKLAAVVAISLFSSMSFAAVFGASVPLVLNKFKVDPAIASGPFVTIASDLSSLLIYFGVTISLLHLI